VHARDIILLLKTGGGGRAGGVNQETFFNTTFSDFVIYSNARYAILTIFTGIFIMGVVYSIRLEPPEEQEAWFSNAHMFTKLDNWRKVQMQKVANRNVWISGGRSLTRRSPSFKDRSLTPRALS
jgi:hypothetical protein